MDNFDQIYYKIGENGEWIEGTKFSVFDYDLTRNKLVNEDGTITIFARIVNKQSNNEVIVNEKCGVDTIDESRTIEADSLIQAVKDNSFRNGIYTVKVAEETYNLKVYNIDKNVEMSAYTAPGIEEDVFNSSGWAKNMIVLKVEGDLTIDSNVVLSSYASKNGYGGPKGMMIYCTGTLINNGTISMSARGARAEGQNVYLWKNGDNSYETVPKYGGNGGSLVQCVKGDSSWKNGNTGGAGVDRGTGGGGSGGSTTDMSVHYGISGPGAQGTSYSGGTGGGGVHGTGTTVVSGRRAGGGEANGGARWSRKWKKQWSSVILVMEQEGY